MDPLTGLASRQAIHEAIESWLAVDHTANETTRKLVSECENEYDNEQGGLGRSAFLLVDIDRFTELNRELGFRAGDQVLRCCAVWLKDQVRELDLLARHDGARFAVWMRDASQKVEVLQLAQRLAQVSEVVKDQLGHIVTVSVGCALFPDHGKTLDTWLSNALQALGVAKDAGGNQIKVFNSAPSEVNKNPNAWVTQNELDGAIGTDTLVLHYQPVCELATGRLVGVEALLRPRIEALAGASTEALMNLAESLPVIENLSRWGIRTACLAVHDLESIGGIQPSVAVNLPPQVIRHPALLQWVREGLEASALPAHRLTIEVTERALIQAVTAQGDTALMGSLRALHELGCLIALDDFGVGYSALAQLVQLPLHKVKFDRSLLPKSADDTRAVVLLRHLLALSRDLGIIAVAEGIETEAQRDLLLTLGCPQGQGYLYGRPMAIEGVNEWIKERNPKR